MRVLSFDPGYERLGVAVLEKEKGKKEILLFSDCIAIENLYFEKNAKTAMNVSAVRGMLLYIAASRGLPAHEYTPLQVKAAVTGYGRGSKADIALMVPKLLALTPRMRLDDELDAIAVGITCLASIR